MGNKSPYICRLKSFSRPKCSGTASKRSKRSAILWGGILGGAGLCFILLCSHLAILSIDQFYQYNIPMAEVVRRFNATFHFSLSLLFLGKYLQH